MIVTWDKPKAGILIIPCVRDSKVFKNLVLTPGNNEISDEDWKLARLACEPHVKAGFIKEVVKVIVEKVKDKDGKDTGKTVEKTKSLTLKDLDPNECEVIIKDTWHLDTLDNWRKIETRDEVRALLLNQKERIEEEAKGIKQKKGNR